MRLLSFKKSNYFSSGNFVKKHTKKGLIFKGPLIYERFLRELTPSQIIVDNPSLLLKVKTYSQLYRPDLLARCELAKKTELPLLEHYGFREDFDALEEPVVFMQNGGSLIFESTTCVTTVDVNLGRGGETATNIEASFFHCPAIEVASYFW